MFVKEYTSARIVVFGGRFVFNIAEIQKFHSLPSSAYFCQAHHVSEALQPPVRQFRPLEIGNPAQKIEQPKAGDWAQKHDNHFPKSLSIYMLPPRSRNAKRHLDSVKADAGADRAKGRSCPIHGGKGHILYPMPSCSSPAHPSDFSAESIPHLHARPQRNPITATASLEKRYVE